MISPPGISRGRHLHPEVQQAGAGSADPSTVQGATDWRPLGRQMSRGLLSVHALLT